MASGCVLAALAAALHLLLALDGAAGTSSCKPKSSGLPRDSDGPAALLQSPPFSTTKVTAAVSKTKAHKITVGGKDLVLLTLNDHCNAFSGGWLGSD